MVGYTDKTDQYGCYWSVGQLLVGVGAVELSRHASLEEAALHMRSLPFMEGLCLTSVPVATPIWGHGK